MRWRKTNSPIVRTKKTPETANQMYDSVWSGLLSPFPLGGTVVTVGVAVVTVVVEPENFKN